MSKDPELLLERYLAISRAIAGQFDFQNVLAKIAGEADKLFEHDHMDVCLILPDQPDHSQTFEVGVSTSWSQPPNDPRENDLSPIREMLAGRVKSYLTEDAWEDPRFHFDGAFDAPIFDANLRSRIHVPLSVQGELIGTLNISSHQKNRYDEDDVQIAQQVADLLAPYIYAIIRGEQIKALALAEGAARGREETLRAGTLRLTEGMENERKRIGMDLHDQTLADLTRIHREISRISRQTAPKGSELTGLEVEVSACMSELRRIIEDAKPGVLELFGFAQAVEAQLERSVVGIEPRISTNVLDLASELLDDGPKSLRTTVYRIVQEAINNAIKHGQPDNISVAIEAEGDVLSISVVDDGVGTSKNHVASLGGVDNLRVRAALISANLEVAGDEPGGGTRITLSIPIEELAQDKHALFANSTRTKVAS